MTDPIPADVRSHQRVVAAALRVGAMTFSKPAPARHHDLVHEVADLIGRPVQPDEQGFLTSAGHYVDRETAAFMAFQSDQVEVVKRELFSEDLW